jgi:ketosteroid isomerase-like protein
MRTPEVIVTMVFRSALIVGLLACAVACRPAPAAIETDTAKSVAEIESLLNAYRQAVVAMDLDRFATLWDDRERISLVSPIGRISSMAELEGFFTQMRSSYAKLDFERRNTDVRVDGDSARAAYDYSIDGVGLNGARIQFAGWETQVYRRTAEGWRITHVHYSVAPTAPPGNGN